MQFLDVTRAFRLIVGDGPTEDLSLDHVPLASQFYFKKETATSKFEDQQQTIIQVNEININMLRSAILTKKHIGRRHKALVCSPHTSKFYLYLNVKF